MTSVYSVPNTRLFNAAEHDQFKTTVKGLANESRSLAAEILDNGRPSYVSSGSTKTVHHYHHDYGFGCYPLYQPVYVGGGRGRGRNDDDTGVRVLVGLAATVVGGIALYTIGRSINELQHSGEEITRARDFDDYLASARGRVSADDQVVVEEASVLARLKERIHQRMKNSSIMDLIARITLAAGAALALTGAFAGAPWLMVAGVALGLIAGGAMLFKCGLNTPDRANIRDAQQLQQIADNLSRRV